MIKHVLRKVPTLAINKEPKFSTCEETVKLSSKGPVASERKRLSVYQHLVIYNFEYVYECWFYEKVLFLVKFVLIFRFSRANKRAMFNVQRI